MKPTVGELSRLVGNPEAYALQHEDKERGWLPVREPLTTEVLVSHLREEQTVGTYVGHVQEDGVTRSRTLVFDVDDGSEAHADAIQAALRELGVPPMCIGIEYSGMKGYHVWVPLQEYRPNPELRRVGRAALALARAAAPGLSPATEVFPKQDEVRDLGNLVKLPGGIHQVSKKHNNFLTKPPLPLSTARLDGVLALLPAEVAARRTVSENRFPCMEEIQKGVSSNRNIQLFHLATMLRRAGVDDDNLEVLMQRVNDLGDPLEGYELDSVVENSKQAGPLCDQLDRPCGDLCIRERLKGLYTRPGQLRFASEGENVVVTLTEHDGNIVVMEHPDVSRMQASLKYKGGKGAR